MKSSITRYIIDFHRSVALAALCLFFPAGSALAATNDEGYRLMPGDSIAIEVYDQSDLATRQEIDEQGRVGMKYIGPIVLTGKTIREAERAIETEYRQQEYLRAPEAAVSIVKYGSKPVIVKGAVNNPGLVELDRHPDGLELQQIIAMAGGLRDVAKESAVRVIRNLPDGGSQVHTVDLSTKNLKKNSQTERFIVLPRDIVEVSETAF